MMATPKNALIRHVLVALLTLLVAAGLAACNRPSGDEPGTCAPEDLIAPDPTYPVHNSVISDLSPTYQWTYPDYDCLPDEYKVLVSSSNAWFDSGPILAEAVVSGTTTSWHPDLTLVPGDIYYFFVYSRAGSEEHFRGITFWTGPTCAETGDAIQAPELVAPANGERLSAMRAQLRWDDPTPCVSRHHYWVEISTSRSFADSYLQWNSIFEDGRLPDESFTLEPCTTYYWRVYSATSGIAPDGPHSETWSFTTPAESGTVCLAEPVITPMIPGPGIDVPLTGHAAIAGHVWHDECAVPYESTDVAPPGCVLMPDGGMEANGILDSGESGIEGVTVLLDDGTCPGTDGWSSTTDAGGYYSFRDLTAGTYCIEIDAASDGNEDVLIPGNWTVPYRWYGPGPISVEVTLGSDDDISRMNDFAWDYQFLPAPAAVTPSGTPFARVIQDAHCRSGPGVIYPLVTFLSQGQSFPIQGRNSDSTWWWIDRPDGDCWLADSVVETEGDTGSVPEQAAPPTPTVTPVLGCWVQPNPNLPNQCVVPCPPEVQNPSWCTP